MNYKNNTYFYIINIRGDVEAILDINGNEVASYSYDVWGVPTATNPNSLPNPFLYQGAYGNIWDSEIELYYMNARHYDPSIGRFITQDREHGTLTNTMSQNLYIYCYNNPYAFTDSSGFAVDPGIGGPSPMTKDDLTAEQRELYEWLEEYDDYSGTIEEFLDLWDKSQDVADRMQKYDNDEENKYDFKIAFMACYWNDKGAVGLSGDSLISFANLMKGICYMETELGNLGHYKEGLFQVSTLKDLSTSGWISKKLYNDYNNKLGTNPNAGIFTGIAHWLKDYSGWAATGEDELDMNFNDFKAIKNKIHTKEIWKLATERFCGGCDVGERAKQLGSSYSEMVFDLVERGIDTHLFEDANSPTGWRRSTKKRWTKVRGTGSHEWDADTFEYYFTIIGRNLVEEGYMNDSNLILP
ncbi:MAG TPA: RHS repeat-associated core domain-containing protein [Caldisericia bacterium]|nr:RHS repeat-associated core domain-containing protein [Caldisericia bacterium]